MWRIILLGVVLAGVLAGCSLDGGCGAGGRAPVPAVSAVRRWRTSTRTRLLGSNRATCKAGVVVRRISRACRAKRRLESRASAAEAPDGCDSWELHRHFVGSGARVFSRSTRESP